MIGGLVIFFVLLIGCVNLIASHCDEAWHVTAQTESGWVRGVRRIADYGTIMASFMGVPYAKQPIGELRFSELQPAEPWSGLLDATKEGPICPQYDEVYGNLVKSNRKMSEACMYANIHVPAAALPQNHQDSIHNKDDVHPVHGGSVADDESRESINHENTPGLPILVYIHGGGFQVGSGDSDLNGPEYLVSKGMAVFTFNYRINVFGYLSLNTPEIPGNNGLRDCITFLKWVKRNARSFGGDPDDVTVMGQSAGAATIHLLSLSDAAKGLFKRMILLSGTGIPSFFSASPIFAQSLVTMFLTQLGVNSTDTDAIHKELISMPLDKIMTANKQVQFQTGTTSFVPVVEGVHPGVTRVIDDEPINLIKRGRGKEYPAIIGFTNSEVEFFKRRLENVDIIGRINNNTALLLNNRLIASTPPNIALDLGRRVFEKYFHGRANLQEYIDICKYNYFEYPAFKLAQWRSESGSAPTFLYRFTYNSDLKIIKESLFLDDYVGATHVEDLTYVLRVNQYLGDFGRLPPKDNRMKDWMTSFVYNFTKCSSPTCTCGGSPPWPQVQKGILNYQAISEPGLYANTGPTPEQRDMINFFDRIEQEARDSTLQIGRMTD